MDERLERSHQKTCHFLRVSRSSRSTLFVLPVQRSTRENNTMPIINVSDEAFAIYDPTTGKYANDINSWQPQWVDTLEEAEVATSVRSLKTNMTQANVYSGVWGDRTAHGALAGPRPYSDTVQIIRVHTVRAAGGAVFTRTGGAAKDQAQIDAKEGRNKAERARLAAIMGTKRR